MAFMAQHCASAALLRCCNPWPAMMPDRPRQNPDPKIRKTFTMNMSFWVRIEDWALGKRIKNDSAAIRALLARGLQSVLRNDRRQ